MKIEALHNALVDVQDACRKLSGGEYAVRRLHENHVALIQRFCPFKAGDRVILTRAPKITAERAWGWMNSRHFLIKGALGTVREVDCLDGRFVADVEWDNQTWIDRDGIAQKIEKPAAYCHDEDYLVRCPRAERTPPTSGTGAGEKSE